MTKGEKFILGALIAMLAFGAALWKRQAAIQRQQQQLDRKINRSPFFVETNAPAK